MGRLYKIVKDVIGLPREYVTCVSENVAINILANILSKKQEEILVDVDYYVKENGINCLYKIIDQNKKLLC